MSGRPRTRSGRGGFAAVVALLFLATTAATVVSSTRGRTEITRLELIEAQTMRARFAAEAGAALARSAMRAGLDPGAVRPDPSLPMISIEETAEGTETVWIVRVSVGVARRELRVRR
jgi:hypothetical protein